MTLGHQHQLVEEGGSNSHIQGLKDTYWLHSHARHVNECMHEYHNVESDSWLEI